MGSCLHALSSHGALLLLRHSFAILKILYVFRTTPCFLSPKLARFDESLRYLLCVILNVPLDDDSAWLQASLPVRSGGIGIRRSVQLAPSAYLASAVCCSELIPLILPPRLHTTSNPLVEEALSLWQATHDNTLPSHPSSHRQRAWYSAVVEASFNALVVCTRHFLQLAFGWTMMSSELQLVFVLVCQCAIPMCALAVVLRSIISGPMA